MHWLGFALFAATFVRDDFVDSTDAYQDVDDAGKTVTEHCENNVNTEKAVDSPCEPTGRHKDECDHV